MVASFRLTAFGHRLPSGMQVLAPETLGAITGADGLLRDAEHRAAEIRAQAEAEAVAACAQGYADGMARARIEAVERLLREGAALDAGLRAAEAGLVAVVAEALRKLASGFDDIARIEAVVRGALRQMRREKRAELRVASMHHAALRERAGAILAEFPEVELLDVVDDPGLAPTAIVLESSIGRVEASFEGGLADLDAMIRAALAPIGAEGREGEAR